MAIIANAFELGTRKRGKELEIQVNMGVIICP